MARDESPDTNSPEAPSPVSRRRFIALGAAAGVAGPSLNLLTAAEPAGASSPAKNPSRRSARTIAARSRAQKAFEVRMRAATSQRDLLEVAHPVNDDEALPGHVASFSKSLPHDELGHVDPASYQALLAALASGKPADFEKVRMGGAARLDNPQASFSYVLEGCDPHCTTILAPPSFSSAALAGEAVENYWHALTRDIPFAHYGASELTQKAAKELSQLSAYEAPRENGSITPRTLFRGNTPGDLAGPYVSQFLWKEIAYGSIQLFPKVRTLFSGYDYLTTWDEWLAVQNGAPGRAVQLATHRYIRNGRDLSAYVRFDFPYQAGLNAALILFSMQGTTDATKPYRGAPYDKGNPYRSLRSTRGSVTFGGFHILDLVSRVCSAALKASWYQKWLLHRRLRPEEFGGRVHNAMTKRHDAPLHRELLESVALEETFKKHGTYLMPMAYPEGCPIHPAFPAGHAAFVGASVTVLKAFFDESFIIDDPVETTADGLALVPWRGEPLTVGGELNKLAANVSLGRNIAGVHWRSDGIEGLKLGEAVALSILGDMKECFYEEFGGFSLTKFDGTTVTV